MVVRPFEALVDGGFLYITRVCRYIRRSACTREACLAADSPTKPNSCRSSENRKKSAEDGTKAVVFAIENESIGLTDQTERKADTHQV